MCLQKCGLSYYSKCTKLVFGRGSSPDPAGGAYNAPADPLVGWEGRHPLNAFGIPIPRPLTNNIPGYAYLPPI